MAADRTFLRPLVAAAAVAVAITMSHDAGAFCRTRTLPAPPDFEPQPGRCFAQGQPLYHPSQCLTYRLPAQSSPIISNDAVSEALGRAFATWTAPNASCAPGISAIELAPFEGPAKVEYRMNDPNGNANLIMVLSGKWPHGDGATLALSTLTFDADTGEVRDADMEINGEDRLWSFRGTPPEDGYDFDTMMLHEAGHFLGLAHTAETKAAMFASYTPGTRNVKLSDDDTVGICSIYPSRQVRVTGRGSIASTQCQLAASSGSSACGDAAITHGCAVGGTSESSVQRPWAWGSMAAGAALLAALARRRRRMLRA